MKLFYGEKALRTAVFLFGAATVGLSLFHLVTGLGLPGLEPMIAALFWGTLWRWNVVKKTHPGGIWTVLYLIIILLNTCAGISQLWVAVR